MSFKVDIRTTGVIQSWYKNNQGHPRLIQEQPVSSKVDIRTASVIQSWHKNSQCHPKLIQEQPVSSKVILLWYKSCFKTSVLIPTFHLKLTDSVNGIVGFFEWIRSIPMVDCYSELQVLHYLTDNSNSMLLHSQNDVCHELQRKSRKLHGDQKCAAQPHHSLRY